MQPKTGLQSTHVHTHQYLHKLIDCVCVSARADTQTHTQAHAQAHAPGCMCMYVYIDTFAHVQELLTEFKACMYMYVHVRAHVKCDSPFKHVQGSSGNTQRHCCNLRTAFEGMRVHLSARVRLLVRVYSHIPFLVHLRAHGLNCN